MSRTKKTQAVKILKRHGFTRKFRGQSKREPLAAGQLSEFYPVENLHADRKRAIVAFVRQDPRWRHGVGAPPPYRECRADSASKKLEGTWVERSVKFCLVPWSSRTVDVSSTGPNVVRIEVCHLRSRVVG